MIKPQHRVMLHIPLDLAVAIEKIAEDDAEAYSRCVIALLREAVRARSGEEDAEGVRP